MNILEGLLEGRLALAEGVGDLKGRRTKPMPEKENAPPCARGKLRAPLLLPGIHDKDEVRFVGFLGNELASAVSGNIMPLFLHHTLGLWIRRYVH